METLQWKLVWVLSLISVNCLAADKVVQYRDIIVQRCDGCGRGFEKRYHRELGFEHPHIIIDGVKLDYDWDQQTFIVAKDQRFAGDPVLWELEIEGEYPDHKYTATLSYPNRVLELGRRRREAEKNDLQP